MNILVIPVQTVSDIITNSSSEVFILDTGKTCEEVDTMLHTFTSGFSYPEVQTSPAMICSPLVLTMIKTHLYPPESLSKNVILTKDKVQITPSSFNLKPIRVINL